MQDETIKLLIGKIQNGLPEIKIRSISTLYTKITIGIIQSKQLPLFINLPGVLLQWINDNRTRSQPLFKVLTILNNFSKTTEGLTLLQQYQALEFFQMYRQYLLEQQPRHDQYTNLLQSLIKILIPLSSDKEEEKIESKYIEQAQQKQIIDKKQKKQKGETAKNKEIIKGAIKMSWTVIRQPLGKKQQDELYSLMMQIRHSKKQLQLQWLKRIQQLIRYWGYKSFRFRVELINQLTEQFPKSNFKWLIISILTAIIRGIGQVSQQYSSHELKMLKFSNPQQILQPQTEKIALTLKKQLFESIYSHLLLDQLIKYSDQAKESDLQQVLTQISYRFTPYYFIYGLQKITKNEKSVIDLQTLNQSIEYYCQYYQGFPDQISRILSESHQSHCLSPDKFPILKNCLSKVKKNKSLSYIQGYGENWQLGLNLHLVAQIVSDLQNGIEAVQISNSSHYISIYLNAILTLAISVEKQEPLMRFYPKAAHLISILAINSFLSQEVFRQIRELVGSDSTIKYGSKNYNKSELALLVFSEENMYSSMFSTSFANQSSLEYWLEITNAIVVKNKSFCELDTYFCIIYCLGYHKNQTIKNLSKKLLQSLTKKGKKDVYYCRLFSKSQEQRAKVAKELFDQNSGEIIAHLENKTPKPAASNKKPLKISQQSMQNYINIILNKSLSDEIRINASKQLIQSLQRIELNPVLSEVLSSFSERIALSLSQSLGSLPIYIYSFFIQINGILNQILQQKYYLQVEATINLLQIKLPAKAVQILLQNLYSSIFQNPFEKDKQIHYIALLYPHIKYQQLKVGGQMTIAQKNINEDQKPSKILKSPIDDSEYLPQFEKFIQLHIYKILNNQKIKLDQSFVSLVQKQIGNVLHATKGIASLHYLSFSLSFFKNKKIPFPQKMEDYSTPLLNSLLSKDQNANNCEPLAKIISVIGVKRSRQILNLLSSNPQGIWKYHILLQLQSIEDSLFDVIIKGLLGMSNGLEAILILRLVLRQSKQSKISIFSQTMILNSCIKFARQGEDVVLRKTAICVLTELYKTPNMACEGSQDIFGSIASILMEDCLTISEINLFLNLIKTIIDKDAQIIDQTHIAKLLLEKMVGVLSHPQLSSLTMTILFEIMNLVTINNRELLTKYDLVDLALNDFTKAIEKKQIDSLKIKSMATILDFIYLQIEFDLNLPKYILSSTSLLKKVVDFLKIEYSEIIKPIMQAVGRLILKISANQEDLFVYKLNQIVKNQLKSLFGILSLNLHNAGNNYLKMMGWLMVIWLRNREDLQPIIGQQYSQIVLNSAHPQLIKQVLPFSLQAKKMFLNSKYLLDLLKENHAILDNRILKQSKDKKRKIKIYQLDIQETHTLQSFFSLLSALFYWGDSFHQAEIKEPEPIKKIIAFIEKFYSCGLWEENIVKQYLKAVTNMTVGSPLGSTCSSRLAENGIMIEDVVYTVIKCENFDGPGKLALKLLSVLVNFQSIRSIVLRARVIEQLASKLIKGQQKGDISIETMMDIIQLFLSFSSYKDSNIRLFNDKKVLQILIRILKMGKFSLLQQKIIILMGNLACFKSNKPTFMSNREIHKVILGLLEDKDITYHEYLINLLYNIVYKNSAALKLYRRSQVVLLIKNVSENCHNEVRKGLLEALVSQETF